MATIAERISLAKTCLEADLDKAAFLILRHICEQEHYQTYILNDWCTTVYSVSFSQTNTVPAMSILRCLEAKIDILW
jgi:hypothetical protein